MNTLTEILKRLKLLQQQIEQLKKQLEEPPQPPTYVHK